MSLATTLHTVTLTVTSAFSVSQPEGCTKLTLYVPDCKVVVSDKTVPPLYTFTELVAIELTLNFKSNTVAGAQNCCGVTVGALGAGVTTTVTV